MTLTEWITIGTLIIIVLVMFVLMGMDVIKDIKNLKKNREELRK